MESSVLNFQTVLQSLTFKSFYHNQTQQFDYDNLFLNKRIVIFSIPNMFGAMSLKQLKQYTASYNELIKLGIDDVYCVNSNTMLIGPWVDKHSVVIKGLYDEGLFVEEISKYHNINKPLNNLKTFWQYVAIIKNGNVEMSWQNPIKDKMPAAIIKNPRYAYHNLTVEKVKEYLASTK